MLNRFAAFRTNFLQDISKVQTTTKTLSPQTTSNAFLNTMASLVQAKSNIASTIVKPVAEQPARITISKAVDKNLDVKHYRQYKNECGPTSLAMILDYFGKDVSNYHNWFKYDTVGHGPTQLKNIALKNNMLVRQENNGSLEDLAKLVDRGLPAMVLGIYGGGNTTTLSTYVNNFEDNAKSAHWMVVTGYKRDESGKITHIYFNNPNSSKDQCWTAKDFMEKFWDNNIIPGGHRYYMTMAPQGTYQASSLKKLLPEDKMSKTFKETLETVNTLEVSAYKAIKAGKSIASAVKKAYSELQDTAEEVASTFENAWDTVSGWFS